MIGISFFIEQFLGLITGEIWDCSKEKIRTAYKNNKNAVGETKTFETRMYTAIVDAFCYYANVNPKNARPDIMDFIYTTAEVYFNESQRNQDNTPATLLEALHSLDSKFGDTTLFKNYKSKKKKDDAKIEKVAKYLQKYIVKDDKFKDEYINEVLTRLLKMGQRIEKMQLEQQLFPELVIAAVKESEQSINANINTTMAKESDRVISVVSDKIDSWGKEQFYEPYPVQETKHEFEKPKFKDVKTEYVDKWNEKLFLHRRPGDEELTLRNTYIPTLYETIMPESDRLDEPQDDLNIKLEKFIHHGKSLLLIGPPGIGKTSIVCYLADKYKNDPDVIILRFSDWSEEEWASYACKTHGSILMKAITHKLKCLEKELRDKLLILDGFDEIKYYSGSNNLLKSFLLQIRSIQNLRVIITTRDNYINLFIVKFQKVIKLCMFNESKIIEYTNSILPEYKLNESDLSSINKKVYGIPVILYMAVAAGIDICKTSNRYGVYDKIFAIDGGIFDRFSTESIAGYDDFSTHDITYKKEVFLKILRRTAFTMFKIYNYNSIDYISYQTIVENLAHDFSTKPSVWYDFPIDNLYEKGNRIEFIHKSIYEYFVSDYMYANIFNVCAKNSDVEMASKICLELFCFSEMTNEIYEFLHHKIASSRLDVTSVLTYILEIIGNILEKGPLTYNTLCDIKEAKTKINHIKRLNILFKNLLRFIHCWTPCYDKNDYQNNLLDTIVDYIHCNTTESKVNFESIYLCGRRLAYDVTPTVIQKRKYLLAGAIDNKKHLTYANLDYMSFKKSYLLYINMNNSCLKNTNFQACVLQVVNMNKCDLSYASFESSLLIDSDLTQSQFEHNNFNNTHLENNDFSGSIIEWTTFSDVLSAGINKFHNCVFKSNTFTGNFKNCEFNGSIFDGSFLDSIRFIAVPPSDFSNAVFRNAVFINGTDLRGSKFTGADFRGANLDGAIYTHELDDAILD